MGANQSKTTSSVNEEKMGTRHEPRAVSSLGEKAVLVDRGRPVVLPRALSSRTQHLPVQQLREWKSSFVGSPKNRLAISSLAQNSIDQVLTNESAIRPDVQVFNIQIPIQGTPITNQRSSGRCWLFAATNVFRIPFMKAYNLSEFELSQAYLFYWDKIEKANYFLETIIETAGEDLSSRLVQKLLDDPVSDGGQWDFIANVVEKYGLVPHVLYPDSYHAKNSSKMNWLVTVKLREQALVLRKLARSTEGVHALEETKKRFVQEIHNIITTLLGPPPDPDQAFTWNYKDAKGQVDEVTATPKEFAHQISARLVGSGGLDYRSTLSLVNDPRNEYGRLLTVDKLGNVRDGRPVTYINVDMQTLKSAVIATLRAGHPVFFGCDVTRFYSAKPGVMDTDLLDLQLGFNTTLGMNKAERLETGESAMTHAMMLSGVHLGSDGQPVRWRVENSWGDGVGDHGFFVMTDEWMDEYLYQVVIDPRYVSKEVRDVLKQEPLVLPRWDPMGVLA